jgi:type I restriction enzyme M protein
MEKMTSQQLAEKLKDAIRYFPTFNPAQHKKFIVALLVLKRLSDKFAEELAEEGEDDPNLFETYVPEGARWTTLQRVTEENLGQALNDAVRLLEDNNPHLRGLLSWVDFNNRSELPENVLYQLRRHFSEIQLGDSGLEKGAATVGEAFIEFISYVAEMYEKKAAKDRLTPPDLNRLIAELVEAKHEECVYDPAAGTASTLIAVAQKADGKVTPYGQELDLDNYRLARINLFLHGIDARLEQGDTLRAPAFVEDGRVKKFERVVCHPEFSRRNWGADSATNDPYGRFAYGVPPNNNGDWAFIQHIIASLSEGGRAIVLMPHGVLFRSGAEGEIRKKVIEADLLEAVIGLPEKIFFGVGIPGVILIFSKPKPDERRGKVLFVDASREYQAGTRKNRLRDEDIAKIVETYRQFTEVNGYSKVVTLEEIASHDYNLNLARYLPTAGDEEAIDWTELQGELEGVRNERSSLEEALQKMFEVLGGEME